MRAMWGEVQEQSPLSRDSDLLVCLLMYPQYSALCDSQAINISWIHYLFSLWLNIHNIKTSTLNHTFKCGIKYSKYIHTVVQLSPPSPECLHLPRLRLRAHYTKTVPLCLPALAAAIHSASVAASVLTLGTSREWNRTRLVLLWLAFFHLARCPRGSLISQHVSDFLPL